MNRRKKSLLELESSTEVTGIINKSFHNQSTESLLTSADESVPTRITVRNVDVYKGDEPKPVPMPRSKIPKLVKGQKSTEELLPSIIPPQKPKRRIQRERDIESDLQPVHRERSIPLATFTIDEKPPSGRRRIKETSTSTSIRTSTSTDDLSSTDNKITESKKDLRYKKKKKNLTDRTKSLNSDENSNESDENASIGFYIHELEFLKFQSDLESIHIRISCYDESSGHLLDQSKKGNKKEIQTLVSKNCRFAQVNYLRCIWEELLILQENAGILKRENVIIFFEIVAKLSSSEELKTIAWAFLKPFARDKYDNFEKRLKLQVYYFQSQMTLFQNWRITKKHRRYPSTLSITLKGITAVNNQEELKDQSKLDLEKSTNPFDVSSFWTSKNFKCPDHVYSTLKLSGKGSNLIQINPTGDLIAIANPSKDRSQILLSRIPDLKIVQRLDGHTDFVYGLDWKVTTDYPQVLISCSADHCLFVWTIEKNFSYTVQVIPHLTFMYTCRFWNHHGKDFILVAGKDSIIRVWTPTKASFKNYQEFSKGTGYYTALIVTKSGIVYSGDSEGRVVEWIWKESAFQFSRTILEDKIGITHLELHPRIEKLYVGNSYGLIQSIDLETRLIIHSYQKGLNENQKFFRFKITSCGSYLIAISSSQGIIGWNILTNGELEPFDFIPHSAGFLSSIDLPKRGSFMVLSRYQANKNAVIVLNNSKNVPIRIEPPIKNVSVPHTQTEDTEKKAIKDKLSEIICKLDQVFSGQPQLCDDEKISLINEKNRIEEWLERHVPGDGEVAEEDDEVGSTGTFIVKKGDDKASLANDKEEPLELKGKSNEKEQENVRNNSGTYEIKKLRDTDADDTSLSNSDLNLED